MGELERRLKLTKHPHKKIKLDDSQHRNNNQIQQQIILIDNYTKQINNKNPLIYINKNDKNTIRVKNSFKLPNKYLLKQRIQESKMQNQTDNINNLYGRLNSQGEIRLKIASFNCHGISANKMCVNNIIETHDVCCIQETNHNQTKTLIKHINDKTKQVFDKIGTKAVNIGRTKSGLAFIVDNKLNSTNRY